MLSDGKAPATAWKGLEGRKGRLAIGSKVFLMNNVI